eukprot:TRINITY_DN4781_c0_g2_i14.p1 TRINITY_DN4781_c0_g2~~TRINITY_DN4781_c0_g2_i14.p1  ORF type:complete len:242 (-),score=33.99 TRINITY_DN4781_c0_g2_i14:44-769(-)
MKQYNEQVLDVKKEYDAIRKMFISIIEKIELIASKSFKEYKLKDTHYVCSVVVQSVIKAITNLIAPFISTGIGQLKFKKAFISIMKLQQDFDETDKRKGLEKLKNNTQFLKQVERKAKLKHILLIQQAKSRVNNIKILVQAVAQWKLSIKGAEYHLVESLSLLSRNILAQVMKGNPWEKINSLIHNFLIEQAKTAYADIAFYDPMKTSITIFVPEVLTLNKPLNEGAVSYTHLTLPTNREV